MFVKAEDSEENEEEEHYVDIDENDVSKEELAEKQLQNGYSKTSGWIHNRGVKRKFLFCLIGII